MPVFTKLQTYYNNSDNGKKIQGQFTVPLRK